MTVPSLTVTDCHIQPREGDDFYSRLLRGEPTTIAGYAIVPIEVWDKLRIERDDAYTIIRRTEAAAANEVDAIKERLEAERAPASTRIERLEAAITYAQGEKDMTELPTTHGYVWNCYVKSRDGDAGIFFAHDDTVTARLNGYAIVPREEYEALKTERDAALAELKRLTVEYPAP